MSGSADSEHVAPSHSVMSPGARRFGAAVEFRCWAPLHDRVDVLVYDNPRTDIRAATRVAEDSLPDGSRLVSMTPKAHGWFALRERVPEGFRYAYVVGGRLYPDPASKWQPDGVHGLSALPSEEFSWTDSTFEPPPVYDLIIYEMHVGTFTEHGTFDAAADRLEALAELGITTVELMPVAAFPGTWNWGYDGVYPWAVQESYGGPDGLKRFVDRAHSYGLSVLLDVVLNHLGPEGNYSRQFGPYFTDRYSTPWGEALNFDGPESDAVRAFFLGAVEYLLETYHLDGFRLDAVHEIHDESAVPLLRQIGDVARTVGDRTGVPRVVIAESDLNDRRLVEPVELNGLGLDAAWADDFHHSLHVALTGESAGYYEDYQDVGHLARSIANGWSYSWSYAPSRGRHHGNSPHGLPGSRFVFCAQNHDQVGNRMLGERLRTLAGESADRLARAVLLLAPAIPLLFMGQEYGEDNPFLYFVDHSDEGLLAATREGRTREFRAFHSGDPPDPGNPQTRAQSVLSWELRETGDELLLTRELIRLRREADCFALPQQSQRVHAEVHDGVLIVERSGDTGCGLVLANLSVQTANARMALVSLGERAPLDDFSLRLQLGVLRGVIGTPESLFLGPRSVAVYTSGYPAEECTQFPN